LSFIISLFFFEFCDSLTLRKTFLGIWLHVEIKGEFAVVVYFNSDHAVIVKLKTLQREDKISRQFLDAGTFQSILLFVAFLTVVGIITLKHFSLDRG
jgi:hypothetical protein